MSDNNKSIDEEYPKPDYYFEGGLMVMTAAYHLKRGYCCNNLCRHCPYGKETDEDQRIETPS